MEKLGLTYLLPFMKDTTDHQTNINTLNITEITIYWANNQTAKVRRYHLCPLGEININLSSKLICI